MSRWPRALGRRAGPSGPRDGQAGRGRGFVLQTRPREAGLAPLRRLASACPPHLQAPGPRRRSSRVRGGATSGCRVRAAALKGDTEALPVRNEPQAPTPESPSPPRVSRAMTLALTSTRLETLQEKPQWRESHGPLPGEAGESTRHVHHPCVFLALLSKSTRAARD